MNNTPSAAGIRACAAYGVFFIHFRKQGGLPDGFHLDGVGVAGGAVDLSPGEHDVVAGLQAEQERTVRDCLQCLGEKERQVIHGYFFRQLTVTEIAREMHCSPDCVTSAKRHALKKLREIFAEKQIRTDI